MPDAKSQLQNLRFPIYEIEFMLLGITRVFALLSLSIAFSKNVCADYSRGGTLLSWEWLTDVSEAIVVGKVSGVDQSGAFRLRTETLLKDGERGPSVGDIVSGPVLGHAIPHLRNVEDPSVAHGWGWPVLSDKSTYPTGRRTNLPSWNPTLKRQPDWKVNDRCIVFYGNDITLPIQIINLDRPLVIEVPFLTVDIHGKAITDAAELIASIRRRVSGPEGFGGTFQYVAWRSDLDGGYFYGILVPANDQQIAVRFKQKIARTSAPSQTMKEAVWHADRCSALGAWKYWFGIDRKELDFGKDAVHERRFAIEYLLSIRPNFAKEYAGWTSRYAIKGSFEDQDRLYYQLRHHLVSHRTFPLGWNTLMSNDGHRFALTDANSLSLYEVDQRERRCGLRLHLDRQCDVIHSTMQFSNGNRYLAYNRTDGSVCLVDALDGKPLWESKPPQMTRTEHTHPNSQFFGASVHFSHDSRYLAQHVIIDHRPIPQQKDEGAYYHRPSKIIIWDVATGKRLFAPYSDFKPRLKFHSFDPANSDHLRTSVEANSQLWSVRKAEQVEVGPRE